MILPHVGMPQLYPQEKFESFKVERERGRNHYHDWVDGALNNTETTDNFAYACPLTETVQLGNVATRLPGKTLEWDSAALRITNEEAANPLLTKIYRDGWKIEAVRGAVAGLCFVAGCRA